MLPIGIKAPNFELLNQNGELVKLSDYLGKKVIVYFYSKDNTSGCTRQACAIKALYQRFTELGVVVIGISKGAYYCYYWLSS